LSFALAVGAAAVLIGSGDLHSLALVGIAVLGVCVVLAAGYWFLANRGVRRWLAFGLLVLTPVAIVVIYAWKNVLWEAVVAIALALAAVAAARLSLRAGAENTKMPEHPASRPRHAFIVMNPRSGGGKVAKFKLNEKAEALGAQVALLDGPGRIDVEALARNAVANGCDLLGVAGGDGTQALVAGIAAEHDLPFLVISAGTRNHFALDLGLDRDHPEACLDALTDGVEMRVDLGVVGGRTFVNNASFGVYAEIVQSPAYRNKKRATTLQMMPDLLSGDHGARLAAHVDSVTIDAPKALLVSNNPYRTGILTGLGQRDRLDGGLLGVLAVTVDSAEQSVELMRRGNNRGLTLAAVREVIVEADAGEIPVGIDGETVMMRTPVRCSIRPRALRVLVPKNRPGVSPPTAALYVHRLWRLARGRDDRASATKG
jgi:diacylglycerol kinase family enzyme